MIPIWKDTYYTYAEGDSLTYDIYVGDTLIYHGTAYKIDSAIKVKINDVVANYLYRSIHTLDDVYSADNYAEVTAYIVDSITNEALAQFDFYNDWSYDRHSGIKSIVSRPISNNIAVGQYAMTSIVNAPANLSVTIASGSGYTKIVSTSSLPGTYTKKVDADTTSIEVGINDISGNNESIKYNVADCPSNYVLYYLNAYGGWDSLILQTCKITDNYTRSTAKQLYDNSSAINRGTLNYVNTIAQKYELTTGWLSDNQAKLMHHLLGSTSVYLHDLTNDDITPINLTDSTCEYKSYRSNGGKLFNWTINAQLSQDRQRQ